MGDLTWSDVLERAEDTAQEIAAEYAANDERWHDDGDWRDRVHEAVDGMDVVTWYAKAADLMNVASADAEGDAFDQMKDTDGFSGIDSMGQVYCRLAYYVMYGEVCRTVDAIHEDWDEQAWTIHGAGEGGEDITCSMNELRAGNQCEVEAVCGTFEVTDSLGNHVGNYSVEAGTYTEHQEGLDIEKVCDKCNSTDVVIDAWAEWNTDMQAWTLGDTFQHQYCRACEAETRIISRPYLR